VISDPKRAILEILVDIGPQSRASLADLLGLSRAALSGLSRELIETGVLREAETAYDPNKLGRPSILLELDPVHGYFAGVSIEQQNCPIVLSDMHGEIIAESVLPTSTDPEELAGIISKGVRELLVVSGIAQEKLRGLSVALSGFVDHSRSICLQSAILGWHEVAFATMVEEKTGIPTSLENNANAAAVGEKLFGPGRESADFSVVTFGEGIGCAHYIGGKLFRGHAGGAGELAHCTIELDGAPCRCGKRGCLDTIASRHAVISAARDAGLKAENVQEIEALAKIGDAAAIRILHRAGSAFGLAISHVIQLMNPERVVVAAVEETMGDLFRTVTRQAIDAYVLRSLAAVTEMRFDDVSQNFWARGAAAIAAHRYLTEAGDSEVTQEPA
jgi:predicted NBD/HSP70 family sugar kinase